MMDTIMGGPVRLYKDKINMKLPGGPCSICGCALADVLACSSGGGFEPHQDILAGWGSYGELLFVVGPSCVVGRVMISLLQHWPSKSIESQVQFEQTCMVAGNGNMNFVTLSVAVDHAHVGNGALECVAGMHTLGKLGEDWKPLNKKIVDDMKWEMVETFPGDVIIFDAFVPHRSAPNLDTYSRRNYYLTYNLAVEGVLQQPDYKYFVDKRKNYPSTARL